MLLLLLFCARFATSTDPCASHTPDSIEHRVLNCVLDCTQQSQSCSGVAECISKNLVDLIQSIPCESEDECNPAAVAFVLGEQLRGMWESSAKDLTRCESSKQLNAMCPLCSKEDGCHYLLKSVTQLLEQEQNIMDNMRSMNSRKRNAGFYTMAMTFVSPGLLSLLSPSHVRVLTCLQIVSGIVIVAYGYSQQGLLYAIIAAVSCVFVLCFQLIIITLIHKKALRHLDEHEIRRNE